MQLQKSKTDLKVQAPLASIQLPKRLKLPGIRSMPRTCTICRHPDAGKINLRLIAEEPLRSIEHDTGLAKSSLQRHREFCLPQDILQAQIANKISNSQAMTGQLQKRRKCAEALLQRAIEKRDSKLILAANAQLLKIDEITFKIGSAEKPGPSSRIIVTPEYLRLRNVLLKALQPHGQARIAVASALMEFEKDLPELKLVELEISPPPTDPSSR